MALLESVPWLARWLLIFVIVGVVKSQEPTTPTVVVGSPCQFDTACRIPNSYCKGSKTCSCKSGFSANKERDKCVKVPEKMDVGDPCNDDSVCLFTSKPTRCSDGICRRCNEGSIKEYSNCDDVAGCAYHEYGNSCWRYRELGEKCAANEECWILKNSANTRECKSSMCQCRADYELMSGPLPDGEVDQCLRINRSTASKFGSITAVIFTSLLSCIITV